MRDFDGIEVSSGRRLRAAGVAALAAVAIVAAGVAYLHPRLPTLGAPKAKPSLPTQGAISTPVTAIRQLTYAGGSLWVGYGNLTRGEIYVSSSGSGGWEPLYDGPSPERVQVLDGFSAVITIGNSYLIVGSNGVSPTRPVATGLAISYAFADVRHGLALLSDGSLYETVDGGVWHSLAAKGVPASGVKHDLGLTPGGRAWFLDATDAGEFIYLSEDWGRSWRELTPPGLGSRTDVGVTADGDKLFAWYGARAFQLLPRNAGWDELPPPPLSGLITFDQSGDLVLASGRQVFLQGPDSSWLPLLPRPPEDLAAITAGPGDALYAAGVSGALYVHLGATGTWGRLLPAPQVPGLPNSP